MNKVPLLGERSYQYCAEVSLLNAKNIVIDGSSVTAGLRLSERQSNNNLLVESWTESASLFGSRREGDVHALREPEEGRLPFLSRRSCAIWRTVFECFWELELSSLKYSKELLQLISSVWGPSNISILLCSKSMRIFQRFCAWTGKEVWSRCFEFVVGHV